MTNEQLAAALEANFLTAFTSYRGIREDRSNPALPLLENMFDTLVSELSSIAAQGLRDFDRLTAELQVKDVELQALRAEVQRLGTAYDNMGAELVRLRTEPTLRMGPASRTRPVYRSSPTLASPTIIQDAAPRFDPVAAATPFTQTFSDSSATCSSSDTGSSCDTSSSGSCDVGY